MPANFTSGWLGNGQAAWHNQGVVTEGTLPAREAFEQQTLSSLSRSESFSSHAKPIGVKMATNCGNPQSLLLSSELTPKPCSVSSVNSTKSSKTIRSFGWRTSSAKKLTWTASSFYRMVPKSALPPHSVVRRRTSSLATQSSVALLATSDTTARPVVVPSSLTSALSVKTR